MTRLLTEEEMRESLEHRCTSQPCVACSMTYSGGISPLTLCRKLATAQAARIAELEAKIPPAKEDPPYAKPIRDFVEKPEEEHCLDILASACATMLDNQAHYSETWLQEPHGVDDCPSYYNGCNCTVANYAALIESHERQVARIAELEARLEQAALEESRYVQNEIRREAEWLSDRQNLEAKIAELEAGRDAWKQRAEDNHKHRAVGTKKPCKEYIANLEAKLAESERRRGEAELLVVVAHQGKCWNYAPRTTENEGRARLLEPGPKRKWPLPPCDVCRRNLLRIPPGWGWNHATNGAERFLADEKGGE